MKAALARLQDILRWLAADISLVDEKFRRDLLSNYGSQALTFIFGLINIALITRYAGIATYGAVVLLTSFSLTVTNLATFRTNEAVVFFYRRGVVSDNPGLSKFAILIGQALDLVLAAILVCATILLAPWIAAQFIKNPELKSDVVLYSGVVAATFLRGTPTGLLMAQDRFRQIYLVNVLIPVSQACLLGLMIVYGIELSLGTLILILLACSGLGTLVQYAALIASVWKLRSSRMDWSQSGAYLRYVTATFLSSTLKAGSQNIDPIILAHLTNPAMVGVYGVIRQFLKPLNNLLIPFSQQLYPRFVSAVATGRMSEVKAAIREINSRLGPIFSLLIPATLAAFMGYCLLVRIEISTSVLVTLGLLAAAFYVGQRLWWVRSFSNALDPNLSLFGNAIVTVVILATMYPLTYVFGMPGTAASLLLSSICLTLYWARQLRRARE